MLCVCLSGKGSSLWLVRDGSSLCTCYMDLMVVSHLCQIWWWCHTCVRFDGGVTLVSDLMVVFHLSDLMVVFHLSDLMVVSHLCQI